MTDRDKTVALCIDLQERILPAMRKNEELVEKCIKLINGLKVEEVPIIATQQYTKGLGETIPSVKEALGEATYIEKIEYSAYNAIKPGLKSPAECPNVIIFGIESHVCVLQTAIELKEQGYRPILVTDCISSRSKHDMKTALIRAQQEGITLTTCESILFELDRAAGTPRAKALQKVVK